MPDHNETDRQKFIQAQLVAKAAAKKGQERLDNIKQAEQNKDWAKKEAEAIKRERASLKKERIANHQKRKWAVRLMILGLLLIVGGCILPFIPIVTGISIGTLFVVGWAIALLGTLPLSGGATLGGFSMTAMHPKMIFTVKDVEDIFKHGEAKLNKREQELADFIKLYKLPTITVGSSATSETPSETQNSATIVDPSKPMNSTTTTLAPTPKKK